MSEERQQGEERRQAEQTPGESPSATGGDNQNTCPECGGSGKIQEDLNCPNCGGTGKVAAVGQG
jgi:DnaJ-class molecular chaperone